MTQRNTLRSLLNARPLRVLVLAAVLGALMVGCQGTPAGSPSRYSAESGTSTDAAAVRSGTGERRNDLEPLTSRFPVLSAASSATWMSGTLGDSTVPGPSTYWIDAIVALPDSEFEKLRASFGASASNDVPELVDGLQEEAPAGPFLTSDSLDAIFSTSPYQSAVFLDESSRSVVIRSVFQ